MHASTFFFTVIIALVSLVAATPPACLLAAVQEQPNPSDLKALCGTLESAVAGNITDKCSGDAKKSAISAYSATCLAEGVTVSMPTATSTKKGSSTLGSGTGTATAAPTTTGSTTDVDSAGSSGTPSGSAATPSSTKNAAISLPYQSNTVLGSLFLGLVYLL